MRIIPLDRRDVRWLGVTGACPNCVLSCRQLPNRAYVAIDLQEPLKVPEASLLVAFQVPWLG